MFITKNKVRMHDTDMAGILYFPRQFRFMHDAFEDMMHTEGYCYNKIFKSDDFVYVVVHAESDYIKALHVSDDLEVRVCIEAIGTTSFTVSYEIYRLGNVEPELVGRGKTVHVTLKNSTRTKIPIPEKLRKTLERFAAPCLK